jgi:prefoldin alpha subunit
MEQQEYFIKMQMLGQEAEKIEQQIQTIDQQISELASVRESLQALESGKQKEILANLGKGIFIKTELKGKELLVNVGKEIIVEKSINDTLKVIEDQTTKLITGKEGFISRIQELQENMQTLLMQAQKENPSGSEEHCHTCDGDCDCQEPCEDCSCHKK